MTRKNRYPVCLRCEFGYPIIMLPDEKGQCFVCPDCGYTISFKDWIINGGEENERS